MLTLFCKRPHVRDVDFNTARFVVSKSCGLDVDGGHLKMGDLIPQGVLSAYALRCLYDAPLRRIDTVEYALTDPELAPLCHDLPAPPPVVEEVVAPAPRVFHPDPGSLTYYKMKELCRLNGVSDIGSKLQLKIRLEKLMAE